jgi:hypothetical protein
MTTTLPNSFVFSARSGLLFRLTTERAADFNTWKIMGVSNGLTLQISRESRYDCVELPVACAIWQKRLIRMDTGLNSKNTILTQIMIQDWYTYSVDELETVWAEIVALRRVVQRNWDYFSLPSGRSEERLIPFSL